MVFKKCEKRLASAAVSAAAAEGSLGLALVAMGEQMRPSMALTTGPTRPLPEAIEPGRPVHAHVGGEMAVIQLPISPLWIALW